MKSRAEYLITQGSVASQDAHKVGTFDEADAAFPRLRINDPERCMRIDCEFIAADSRRSVSKF